MWKLEVAECPPEKESLLRKEEDGIISEWGSRLGKSQLRILSERDHLGKIKELIETGKSEFHSDKLQSSEEWSK